MVALSLLLIFAPIPKTDPARTVAIVKGSPVPAELIVLRSTGQPVTRFDLPKLDGRVTAIRLSPDRNSVAILCQMAMKDGIAIAGRIRPPYSIFILPFDQPDKTTQKIVSGGLGIPSLNWIDNKTLFINELE